ncbi:MAG: hypothetical protein R2731_16515 [Nocardioides sp.]
MPPSVLLGLVAGLAGAVLFGTSSVLQAHTVRAMPASTARLGTFVAAAIRQPRLLLVVAAYLGGFALHAVAIWLLPLYLAQAAVAGALPVSALVAGRIEATPRRRQWVAVGAVVSGLVLLAVAAGQPGEVRTSPVFAGSLVAGVGMIAVSPVATICRGARHAVGRRVRRLGDRGAWRGLATRGPGRCVRAYGAGLRTARLLALLVGAGGGAVPVSTAPMIAMQTAGPALLGVALLGDTVRPGWWWR